MESYHPLRLLSASRLARGKNRPYKRTLHSNLQSIKRGGLFDLTQSKTKFLTLLQVPVSIADLGGTEIDLRFASSKEGRVFVIVAPVLRFADSKFLPHSIALHQNNVSLNAYTNHFINLTVITNNTLGA